MKIAGMFGSGLAVAGLCVLACGVVAQQNTITGTSVAPTGSPMTAATQGNDRQTAQSILERYQVVPPGVKSEQLEMTITFSLGDANTASLALKVVRVGKQFRLEAKPVGKGRGELGRGASQLQMLIVSDGANQYSLTGKEYSIQPVTTPPALLLSSGAASEIHDLLPSVTIDGQPAYVVRTRSSNTNNRSVMLRFIQQNTYQLLKFEGWNEEPGNTARLVGIVKSETFDKAVPDSLFKFNPPRGAKQIYVTAQTPVNSIQTAMLAIAGRSAIPTK